MGKTKQLWQDEIDQAVGEYHDETQNYLSHSLYWGNPTKDLLEKAKKRLVSKLNANGCSADHIEEIVNCECR